MCDTLRLIDSTFLGSDATDLDGSGGHGRGLEPVCRLPANCGQPDRRRLRVWAEQTAFELKDSLKRRGYFWNDGSDGRPKSWFIDVDETAQDDEITFPRTEIYTRDVEPGVQRLTAFTRFSSRI